MMYCIPKGYISEIMRNVYIYIDTLCYIKLYYVVWYGTGLKCFVHYVLRVLYQIQYIISNK